MTPPDPAVALDTVPESLVAGDPVPIFIVGCQRSGTTLLGTLLGRHPDLVCVPEAQFIADLCALAVPEQPLPDVSAMAGRIRAHSRFKLWQFDPGEFERELDQAHTTFAMLIHALIRRYALEQGRAHVPHWIDQQPGNVRYMVRLTAHFPEARMIHMVRDGRAVAASLMPLDWGPNTILSAARYWQEKVGLGFAAEAFMSSDRVLRVHYEDLVRQPQPTLARILRFLALSTDFDDTAPSSLRIPAFTRSQHTKIGQAPDPARIDGWQQQLSLRQIACFEAVTHDLLGYLGYAASVPPLTQPPTRGEAVLDFVLNKIHSTVRRYRYRRKRGLSP